MAEPGDHNLLGVIDRFSKTIKTLINKQFQKNDDTKWFDKLQKLIVAYNNTPHNGIDGMTPNEAEQYVKTTILQN